MLYDIQSLSGLMEELKKESLRIGIPAIDVEDGVILASYAHSVQASGGRIFIDAGAGIGYSTLWIISALRWCSGCKIIAIEYYRNRALKLEEKLADVAGEIGLELEVVTGDAVEILRTVEVIDYAFVDVEKNQYNDVMDILEDKMPRGGVALFHNAYFPPPPQSFFDRINRSRLWNSVVYPTSAGMLAAVKTT